MRTEALTARKVSGMLFKRYPGEIGDEDVDVRVDQTRRQRWSTEVDPLSTLGSQRPRVSPSGRDTALTRSRGSAAWPANRSIPGFRSGGSSGSSTL